MLIVFRSSVLLTQSDRRQCADVPHPTVSRRDADRRTGNSLGDAPGPDSDLAGGLGTLGKVAARR